MKQYAPNFGVVLLCLVIFYLAERSYSAGQSKILYNFGGLDNNLVTPRRYLRAL